MSSVEHRRALRIPCSLPVRVEADGRTITATIHDVSRTGVRLGILSSELGTDDDSLLVLAQIIDRVIGSQFTGDLHYKMLGPLIRKGMRLVRLGQSSPPPTVELGCVFDSPLSDEETSMLGLGLPELGVTTPDAYRKIPPPRRRFTEVEEDPVDHAPRAYDAFLHPTEGLSTEPLAGETQGMRELEAVVQARLNNRMARADLSAITVALAETYGPEPVLEILDGLRMLWSGRVDIRHVEAGSPGRVRIHVAGRD